MEFQENILCHENGDCFFKKMTMKHALMISLFIVGFFLDVSGQYRESSLRTDTLYYGSDWKIRG